MERYILVVVLCFAWTHQAFSDGHDKWDYVLGGEHGPSKWKGVCQTGKKQTPIDIKSLDTIWKEGLGTPTLTNYNEMPNVNFTATNNGHTLTISFPEDVYNVSGIGLTGTYTTVQFHLHWGSTNRKGSEHFLDGKQYAAELHFVSYNTKYANLSMAVTEPDGLAVLGVFIMVGGDNNTNYNFLKYAKDVIGKDTDKKGIDAFKLKGMLPTDLGKFFRYSGSLTTPGCFESVTWTVFKDSVNISEYQMGLLRNLDDSNGVKMVNNFRPLLPVNDRTVYSSFSILGQGATTTPTSEGPSADATAVSMSAALFLLMLVAALFMH